MGLLIGAGITLVLGLLLGRLRRRRERAAVEELGGFLAGGLPVALAHRREAEELARALEEGALDPDELDVEPEWWDEGADDELVLAGYWFHLSAVFLP